MTVQVSGSAHPVTEQLLWYQSSCDSIVTTYLAFIIWRKAWKCEPCAPKTLETWKTKHMKYIHKVYKNNTWFFHFMFSVSFGAVSYLDNYSFCKKTNRKKYCKRVTSFFPLSFNRCFRKAWGAVLDNSHEAILVSRVAKSESAANAKHVFPGYCNLVLQKAIQLLSTATETVRFYYADFNLPCSYLFQ